MSEKSTLPTSPLWTSESAAARHPGMARVLVGAAIALVTWQLLSYLILPLVQMLGYQSASAIGYILLVVRFALVVWAYTLAAKTKVLIIPSAVLVALSVGLTSLVAIPSFPLSYASSYLVLGTTGPMIIYGFIALVQFSSWLVLRGRPVRSVVAAVPVVAVAACMTLLGSLTNNVFWNLPPVVGPVVALTFVGSAWLAAAIDPQRREIFAAAKSAPQNQAPTASPIVAQGQTNGLAIAALIVVFFSSVIGLILGHVALAQIRQSGQPGRGLALAAVVIGWVATGLAVVVVVAYFIFLGANLSRYH